MLKQSGCILLAIILSVVHASDHAAEWQGECVSVTDGDTIRVMHDGCEERIRLYGIDCPERGQDFGTVARRFTGDFAHGKTVTVVHVDIDHYKRTVGLVYVGEDCLNTALLEAGLAWVYIQYCNLATCEGWRGLEKAAREAKSGLWSTPKPVPPWEWRREKRAGK